MCFPVLRDQESILGHKGSTSVEKDGLINQKNKTNPQAVNTCTTHILNLALFPPV